MTSNFNHMNSNIFHYLNSLNFKYLTCFEKSYLLNLKQFTFCDVKKAFDVIEHDVLMFTYRQGGLVVCSDRPTPPQSLPTHSNCSSFFSNDFSLLWFPFCIVYIVVMSFTLLFPIYIGPILLYEIVIKIVKFK